MMDKIRFIFSFLLFIISSNEAARILVVIPFPSISHQVVFRPLVLELARRGHELTVITTDPQIPKGESIANLTEIDVHDISYKCWREEAIKTTTGKKEDTLTQIRIVMGVILTVFEKQIGTKEVQDLIKNKNNFDLLLVETLVRPALAFAHIFKIPAILVSSLGSIMDVNEVIGAPTHPILYPIIYRQKINNLSFWEKVVELYNHYKIQYILHNSLHNENDGLKRLFGADFPTYEELSDYVQMSFLNVYPIWENNRPVPPSVIYMGGIHRNPRKDLPKDLEMYLNNSRNGVIYISFGTNVVPSMLPSERIQLLVQVFAELPYDILWKYDKDELPGKSNNIRLAKWLPQSDLLRHPKIKLFIMQGGLQSTDEAITAGVPLIAIPMLGDQWFNADRYVQHKIGVKLELESMTRNQFKNAIQTVLGDESYKNNIIRLRSIIHDQPQSALDRAVWWTEHVLRHGGAKHLRSPTANMSWAEYLQLDVVAFVLLSFILFITFVVLILRYLFRLIIRNYIATPKIKTS